MSSSLGLPCWLLLSGSPLFYSYRNEILQLGYEEASFLCFNCGYSLPDLMATLRSKPDWNCETNHRVFLEKSKIQQSKQKANKLNLSQNPAKPPPKQTKNTQETYMQEIQMSQQNIKLISTFISLLSVLGAQLTTCCKFQSSFKQRPH